MKEKIAIYGCGAFALKVKRHMERDGDAEIVAFTIHNAFKKSDEVEGIPVISYEKFVQQRNRSAIKIFVSVGYRRINHIRGEICRAVVLDGFCLANYISPYARVWRGTEMGKNVFVDDEVIIGSDCRIGDGVLFFMRCTLSHDIVVEQNVYFSPAVAVGGNVRIGEYSFLGIHSTVKDGVDLAPSTLVGSAANIIGPTQQGCVYVGNPARPLPGKWSEDVAI